MHTHTRTRTHTCTYTHTHTQKHNTVYYKEARIVHVIFLNFPHQNHNHITITIPYKAVYRSSLDCKFNHYLIMLYLYQFHIIITSANMIYKLLYPDNKNNISNIIMMLA